MGAEAKLAGDLAVVGEPVGIPLAPDAQRGGREQDILPYRTCRQLLFPLRNFGVRRRPRNEGEHDRGPQRQATLKGQRLLAMTWVKRLPAPCQQGSELLPRLAGDEDESPWCELTVVRNADRDGQDALQLLLGRTGLAHGFDRCGFAGGEQVQSGDARRSDGG